MASCRACGAGVGRQFRFCSQCGAAVGVELDLLDLAPPAHDEATVTYGQPGRFWATVGGGVLAVLLGLWALSSFGGGGGGGGTDDAEPHRPTTTKVTARAATSATTEAGPTAPSAAEDASTSTTADASPSTVTIADGGPLLGEPVGLSLLVGTVDRLRRVDLDTGIVTTHERGGLPLFATGDWVLLQGTSGSVRAVAIDDLDGQTPPIWSQSSPAMPLAGPAPGQVWLPDLKGDSLVWRLLDVASREVRQELDTGVTPWWQDQGSTLDPVVVGLGTGEVFERDGDTYRRVADGDLVAVGRTVVLVRHCAHPASCSLQWLDRSTWTESPNPVPDVNAQLVEAASISDDGRLMLYATGGGSRLFDVHRGRDVAEVGNWPGNLAVSPDGRWVALTHTGARLAVYDATRGEVTELPVSTSGAGHVVIVANP